MTLPIPPLQDVVRLTGQDLATTIANLRRHYERPGPVWGYSPAKKLAKAVFSLEMPREAAVKACGAIGPLLGRSYNAQVGGMIWDAAQEHGRFLCHSLQTQRLYLRQDFSIKIDPLFFFREGGKSVFFYLQPRATHVPGMHGLRLIVSAIHSLYAVDEHANADVLLIDLSVPQGGKERVASSYTISDLPLLETSQMEAYFQRFADAHDVVSKEGVIRPERRKPLPRDQDGDLFGPSATI